MEKMMRQLFCLFITIWSASTYAGGGDAFPITKMDWLLMKLRLYELTTKPVPSLGFTFSKGKDADAVKITVAYSPSAKAKDLETLVKYCHIRIEQEAKDLGWTWVKIEDDKVSLSDK